MLQSPFESPRQGRNFHLTGEPGARVPEEPTRPKAASS